MPDPQEPAEPPEVATREEVEALRKELAELKAARDEDDARRAGPITATVVGGFILAGGAAILAVASNFLKTSAPLSVWLVLSGANGLVATLILDYSNRFPPKQANRVLGFGAVGLLMVAVVTNAIANTTGAAGAAGAAENARTMTYVSFGVGAVVALSLGVVWDLGWLRRLWKL